MDKETNHTEPAEEMPYKYMAVIIVRQDIKGARRQSHEHYSDCQEELHDLVIEYLLQGFSVIRYDLWEVEE